MVLLFLFRSVTSVNSYIFFPQTIVKNWKTMFDIKYVADV